MATKMMNVRLPEDMAEELEKVCDEAGQTLSEFVRKLIDDKLYPGTNDKAVPATMDFGGKATLNEEVQSKVYAISEEVAEAKVAKLKEELTGKIEKSVTGTSEVNKNYYESVWNTLTKTIGLLHQKIEEYDKNNKKLNDVQKLVEGLGESMGVVKTNLAMHGHDGVTKIPELDNKLKDLGTKMVVLEATIKNTKKRVPVTPYKFRKLELMDGTKHTYTLYRGPWGLSRPHKIADEEYADLAEPED